MIEQVILVDECDRVIGTEEKLIAHQKALLHRAFSVFIFRRRENSIELLLQQRHRDKYHCGGLWTNTCCSHPRIDESVEQAALRRLKEEMSIQTPLKRVGAFHYIAKFENGLTENEFDHVLVGEYDGIEPIVVNPSEVQDYCWVSFSKLLINLEEDPKQYTPWLKPALNLVLEALCQVS